MAHVIVVTFGNDREYEITVPASDLAAFDRNSARAWLEQEFEALECEPSNPMGKILLLDMILNVAKYGGERRFMAGGEWSRRFAAATAVLLDRPAMRVDVAGFTVG